jgi:hypothetical protein
MANSRACDGCGKKLGDGNPLVAKVFLAPIKEGETRQTHGSYTGHADVGKCCIEKVIGVVKFQKRKKVPRGRPRANSVGTRKGSAAARS